MSDPLIRLQRLVEAVVDGDALTATELARLAPLFVETPPVAVEALVERIRSCAQPEGRLPAGHLVLGAHGDAEVTWHCGPEDTATVVARAAEAVGLLSHALQVLPADRVGVLTSHLGLTPELCADLVQGTTLRARFSPPVLDGLVPTRGRWLLLVAQGIPVVDVVSPYVRDVAGNLDAFAAQRGDSLRDDDDRYDVLDDLLALEPRLREERADQEALCGVTRGPASVVRIDPAALDLSAVDLRLRNVLTALRRDGTQILVCPPHRLALQAVARSGREPPLRVVIATLGQARRPGVWRSTLLRHAEGHRLALDPDVEDPVSALLPREVPRHEVARQCSVPAWQHLRADVRTALLESCDAVDGGAYAAALGCEEILVAMADRDETAGQVDVLCLGADQRSRTPLALALWRGMAPGLRRVGRHR
ncbi:MAG: hypothetical protein ABIJ09_04110 [Pseudomonadota bacterium]